MPVRKTSIKRPGTADRGDRRAYPLHLAEIEEVRADQGAHAAADVSQRRRIPARQHQCDDCCSYRRHEYRERDAHAGDGLSEPVAYCGDTDDGVEDREFHNSFLT